MKKSALTPTLVAAASAVVLALAPLAPASASTAPTAWGVWGDDSPSAPIDWPLTFSAGGMVDATFSVTGTSDVWSPSTDQFPEYFVAASPIGAVFGANGPGSTNNRLLPRSQNDTTTPVVVVVTFDSAVAAGNLGFAVSDLDLGNVTVTATDGSGAPLTGAQIVGDATTTAFNLCDFAGSPCTNTNVPTITQDAFGVTAQGNLISSTGSTAWFRPSAEVKTVTFTYLNQDDEDPTSGRFWFAQTIVPAPAPLPDTGLSSPAVITLLVAGSSLLLAGGLLVARRRG